MGKFLFGFYWTISFDKVNILFRNNITILLPATLTDSLLSFELMQKHVIILIEKNIHIYNALVVRLRFNIWSAIVIVIITGIHSTNNEYISITQ